MQFSDSIIVLLRNGAGLNSDLKHVRQSHLHESGEWQNS